MELNHHQLESFAVMTNHVPILLLSEAPPSRLLKLLEGDTARQANRLLGRTGEPITQCVIRVSLRAQAQDDASDWGSKRSQKV